MLLLIRIIRIKQTQVAIQAVSVVIENVLFFWI